MTLLCARPALAAALLGLLLGLTWAAGAAAADDAKKAEEGKPAPAVNLPATLIDKAVPDAKNAKTLNLKDLQGKKNVVLYFFPKAMTGGWTKEACGFRDLSEQFARLDTVVIGISTDKLEDQQKFTDKEKLNFPLFADTDKSAAKAFGVLNPKGMASRVTFVIDKKGVVRKIFPVKDIGAHLDEVLKYVKENLAEK